MCATNSTHLFIPEYSTVRLHVHNLTNGEEVGCLDADDLHLDEGQLIGGLGCGEGGLMHVLAYTGTWYSQARSNWKLMAYRLC